METANKWLELTTEEQVSYIKTVGAQFGLPSAAIEKDWWVTMVLKALFSLPFVQLIKRIEELNKRFREISFE
jgi:hypothetical protein